MTTVHGTPYRPKDKPIQEDWESVARMFNVDVDVLMDFNFGTTKPAEVNWCLRHYVGCNKVSPSGNNWMFSSSASPGLIYIPPMRDSRISYEGELFCVWAEPGVKRFLDRLRMVSMQARGARAWKVKKLVGVILRAGYPRCLDLWYYNTMNVRAMADWKTPDEKLRKMVEPTKGSFPLDGLSGLYQQHGTEEQHRGFWRIHAVRDLFDSYKCGPMNYLTESERQRLNYSMLADLEMIVTDMELGVSEVLLIGTVRGGAGGASSYSRLALEFRDHIYRLMKDRNHLYSISLR